LSEIGFCGIILFMECDAEQISRAQVVELVFQVSTSCPAMLPIDHSHALYGAVKNAVPAFALCDNLGIHSMRGTPSGGGQLLLDPRKTALRMRMPIEFVPKALQLAGRIVRVHGTPLCIGTANIALLNTANTLWARMVTRKFGSHDERLAKVSLQKDIQEAYPDAKFTIGRVRTIRIHQKQILGFEVLTENLGPDDSIRLQSLGFGGRRAFGCGIFVRVGAKNGT
jgi:CRISPR-associated protein Cas6